MSSFLETNFCTSGSNVELNPSSFYMQKMLYHTKEKIVKILSEILEARANHQLVNF